MAQFISKLGLAQVIDNGTTPSVDVRDVGSELGATIAGGFDSGSVQPEVSYDGTSFAPFGSPATTPAHVVLPPCHSVRFVTTGVAAASATIDIRAGGHKEAIDPALLRR